MAEPALKVETDDDWSIPDRRVRALMREPDSMSDMPDERASFSSRAKLSKAEIEALLRPDLPENLDEEPAEQSTEREYIDFDTPPAGQPNDADMTDARAIAAAISLGFRQDCRLPAAARVTGIQSADFSEVFAGSTQGSACLFFKNDSRQIVCALSLSATLTTSLIDMACGGEGEVGGLSGRALTTIDGEMLSSLLSPIAPSLGIGYALARTEIDARFASAMTPPGMAEIIDLSVTLSGVEAPARLAILHEASAPAQSTPAQGLPSADFAIAMLTARIASLSVPVSSLSNLKPGAMLKLGIPADQPVELLSGGRDGVVAAEGEIGRKGNAIAVRVTRRGAYLRKASRQAKEAL